MSRRNRNSSPISLFAFQDIITSVTAIIILMTLILTLELLTRRSNAAPGAAAHETAARLRQAIEEAQREIERMQTAFEQTGSLVQQAASSSPQQLQSDISRLEKQMVTLQQQLQELERQEEVVSQAKDKQLATSFDRQQDRQELAETEAAAEAALDSAEKLKSEERRIYNASPGADKRAWLVDISAERIVAAPVDKSSPAVEFTGTLLAAPSSNFLNWAKQRSQSREYFVLLLRPGGVESFQTLRADLSGAGFDLGFDLIGANQTVIDAPAN